MADKLIRVDAENTGEYPHMLNALPPVRVEAGQSVQDVEMTEAEYESAKGFGVFKFSDKHASKTPAPKPAKGTASDND